MHLTGDTEEARLNCYRIGPLLYATELPIPELPQAEQSGDTSRVEIRMGRTPERLRDAKAALDGCEANATEFLLRLPGVANYYVRGGAEIIVDRAAGANDLDVRGYLLGNLFAVLCHQRGLLPLHACAVQTRAGAVAFLGDSGAGKSSLAAFLARAGYPILADDICLIDPEAPREARVLPVAPWLKLWGTTLEALGASREGLPRVFSDDDKYRYGLQEQPPSPTMLAAVVLLCRPTPDTGSVPHFARLTPVQALQGVLELTYQSWLVRAIGETEACFLRCSRAIEGVRVTRLQRPWGFDTMGPTLEAFERHVATLPVRT